MGFKKFSYLIIARTICVIVSVVILTQIIMSPGYHAVSVLMSLVLGFQFYEMIRFVSKTNEELTRFFDAARYADFSQRFDAKQMGSGFDGLSNTFQDILNRLQQLRSSQEQELKHIKAVIEHVPVPLLSIHIDGKVTVWNNSARRLFGTHDINHIRDFAQFAHSFPAKIKTFTLGKRQLLNLEIDGVEHRLSIAVTQIITSGQKEILLSMQDIQTELDTAQLNAWQDLVSVLTHEIMNSVTPVASLAKTAVDIVDDMQHKIQNQPQLSEDLADVHSAVETVARRSNGLMKFVTSYRQLTRLPPPNKSQIKISQLFKQVETVATQSWQNRNIKLVSKVLPNELDVFIDREMIEQVLINLLKNAEQAFQNNIDAYVELTASLNLRGRVVIEVSDNGCGIPEKLTSQIFVPYFTTKKDGSGIGLALTRQVMIAHGGNIVLKKSDKQGATFSLTF
ncbi:histidine kinase [Pseudoalteromonas sp. NBT06-2]|uniref:sensor histidine kinase n=1 Tax=Pseudoalteromonas sp. NBT06-2 TaxID=2025950 RepID=UPI000BA4F125|nr:ATP-binding protein [Pseudoalteromonas sp. NBT06-2]PAJ75344.1 histidine kinase [Pseudoalteromonas sp. NBT06-2]